MKAVVVSKGVDILSTLDYLFKRVKQPRKPSSPPLSRRERNVRRLLFRTLHCFPLRSRVHQFCFFIGLKGGNRLRFSHPTPVPFASRRARDARRLLFPHTTFFTNFLTMRFSFLKNLEFSQTKFLVLKSLDTQAYLYR